MLIWNPSKRNPAEWMFFNPTHPSVFIITPRKQESFLFFPNEPVSSPFPTRK